MVVGGRWEVGFGGWGWRVWTWREVVLRGYLKCALGYHTGDTGNIACLGVRFNREGRDRPRRGSRKMTPRFDTLTPPIYNCVCTTT